MNQSLASEEVIYSNIQNEWGMMNKEIIPQLVYCRENMWQSMCSEWVQDLRMLFPPTKSFIGPEARALKLLWSQRTSMSKGERENLYFFFPLNSDAWFTDKNWRNQCTKIESAIFFWRGPDSWYFRLWGPNHLSCHYSTLAGKQAYTLCEETAVVAVFLWNLVYGYWNLNFI